MRRKAYALDLYVRGIHIMNRLLHQQQVVIQRIVSLFFPLNSFFIETYRIAFNLNPEHCTFSHHCKMQSISLNMICILRLFLSYIRCCIYLSFTTMDDSVCTMKIMIQIKRTLRTAPFPCIPFPKRDVKCEWSFCTCSWMNKDFIMANRIGLFGTAQWNIQKLFRPQNFEELNFGRF